MMTEPVIGALGALGYQAHSVYISRYPFGREATISWQSPDLKLRDPTAYPVTVWPTYTDTSIRATLYASVGSGPSPRQPSVERPQVHAPQSQPTEPGCGQTTTPRPTRSVRCTVRSAETVRGGVRHHPLCRFVCRTKTNEALE